MKQYMPGDHDWVDVGPKKLCTLEVPKRTIPPVWPASDKKAHAVWVQGRSLPRLLTLDESRLAERNREEYGEEQDVMETWYKTQLMTPRKKRR